MRFISFIIPCYNSEHTLGKVIGEIDQTVSATDKYEIVLVNDHSKDSVWKIIEGLTNQRTNIVGVDFADNFGQHSALMAGYRMAKGDIIVSLDDDGQTPVNEVYKLINKLEEGYDAVYAKYYKKRESLFRRLGSQVAWWMSRTMINRPKDVTGCSYFVMRRYIMEEVIRYQNCYPYVFGLVIRSTKNIANVYVEHRERAHGRSGYSIKKLLSLWMNGFTAFSVKPLRMAGFIGYLLAIIGFIAMIVIVVKKIMNPSIVTGWSSVMSVVLIVGGVILIMLGIMGEYIGRIYICLNNSPQYVIKRQIDRRGQDKAENMESREFLYECATGKERNE